MQAFIGIVEDDPGLIQLFKMTYKDKAIIVTNVKDFKEKLLPIADQIKIWFLDLEIPSTPEDKTHPAKNGIEVAEILEKLEHSTPRYSISGNNPNEPGFPKHLYTEVIAKNPSAMRKKVKELLQQ